MAEEIYDSLPDVLARAKKWALQAVVAGDRGGAVTLMINQWIPAAIKGDDDDTAVQYFGWLLKALDDIHLARFIQLERGRKTLVGDATAIKEARDHAKANRAEEAVALYKQLPRRRLVHERWEPALLTTKKQVLTEIATRMATTPNEGEADVLFAFLLDTYKEIARGGFGAEEKNFLAVLREVTGGYFQEDRLERFLLQLLPEESGEFCDVTYGNVARIFAIAYQRNWKSLARTIRMLRLTQPLASCSLPAYQLIQGYVHAASELDIAVRKLCDSMQPKDEEGFIKFYDEDYVQGSILAAYPSCTEVTLTILVPTSKNDEGGHRAFERVRDCVSQWKQEFPAYTIHVQVVVIRRVSETECVLREQKF